MKLYTYKSKISKPFAHIEWRNKNTPLEYMEGDYTFKNGIVQIYSENNLFELRLAYNGNLYIKTVSDVKDITRNKIVRQAGIFAKEITQAVQKVKTTVQKNSISNSK